MNLERINVRQPVRKLLKGTTLFTLILGYIDVGDGCWTRNILTSWGCG